MKISEDLKLFLKYAITTMCSYIIFRSSSVIDTIFVGKHISASGLASMSIVVPVVVFCDAITHMLGAGAIVVVGDYLGQKQQQKANALFTKTCISVLCLVAIFSTFIICFSKQIIFFLGGNQELLKDSQIYLKIFAYFLIFKAFEYLLSAFFRLTGRTVIIPFFSLTNTIINFALKYLFVVKMNMGMYGIILSTMLALVIVAGLYMTLFLTDKQPKLSFTKDMGSFKEILYIMYNGLSSLAIFVSVSIFSTTANRMIMKYMGTDGLIAYTPINMLSYINYTFIGVFTTSMTPLISINYGRQDYKKIKTFLKYACVGSFIFSFILFLSASFIPNNIINTFISKGKTENIENLSLYGLGVIRFQLLISLINMTLNEFLTSIQRPLESLVLSLLSALIYPITILVIFPIFFGAKGIFFASPVADVLSAITSLSVVYLGRKKYFKK